MTDWIWPLRWYRFDAGIASGQVYLAQEHGEPEDLVSRGEALDRARARGLSLIAVFPEHSHAVAIGGVGAPTAIPLRWSARAFM